MSETDLPIDVGRVLSLLGIARRSGILLMGQDQVLVAIHVARDRLFVVMASDCSRNIMRKLSALGDGRVVLSRLDGVDREKLGRSLGASSTQIAALPIKSGFAKKLAVLLRQEGFDIDE